MAKNIDLVHIPNLNWSKIFVHIDSQLHTAHMILGFSPISTHFQALKHVIKAHDSRLTYIDIVTKGFITPSPARTFQVELTAQQVTHLI